jgi:hypothetical protein
MAFAEDLAPFFDTDGFAESAVYNGATINGIFERAYVQDDSFSAGVQGYGPAFICAASSVDAVPDGKTIVILGVSYTVLRGEPDGTGVTTLILMRA